VHHRARRTSLQHLAHTAGNNRVFAKRHAQQGLVEHRGQQWRGPGYRYLTVQIRDCLKEYEGILARGGTSGGEPRVLGETVRYAFVCDPDGNHIEISQRASLTGGRL